VPLHNSASKGRLKFQNGVGIPRVETHVSVTLVALPEDSDVRAFLLLLAGAGGGAAGAMGRIEFGSSPFRARSLERRPISR
jgi:hypothetical protein